MSESRRIGEIIGPIVARSLRMASFQDMLSRCPTAEARKSMILVARENEAISDDDAKLLIQVYQLETV